jgi:hypothetical protein
MARRSFPIERTTYDRAGGRPAPDVRQGRLLDRHDDHLRFTVNARVPFDNNAAEREIRMI